jgi:chromosome partitioning protein
VKVITMAAQKGGCGKSALTISCAVLAAQHSKRVLVLDADPQGTARQWHTGRNGRPPEVRGVRDAAELESTLRALPSDSVDFVFIDTPGRDEPGEAAAIHAADLTLIPCRPTMADIRAMPATAAVASRLNRHYTFVLTQVPTRGTRADETAAALAELGEVAPIRIGQRIAWQDSYAASMGVSEYESEGPAARELAALWRWLNARLKGLRNGQTTTNQTDAEISSVRTTQRTAR